MKKRATRRKHLSLETLEGRQLLSTATDQLAAQMSATDTTHPGQVLVDVSTLPAGTDWWNQESVWLDDPSNPDDWSLSAIYIWEPAPVVPQATFTEGLNLATNPTPTPTLTDTQTTTLAVTPLDVAPNSDPNPPVTTTVPTETLVAANQTPIPDNTPFTVAQPVPPSDVVEPTDELPQAPPTPQPTALPPTDSGTAVSTTTNPLPTVPDGTANNPVDATTATTGTTSPEVTSTPNPTPTLVPTSPAPAQPDVNPLNPDPTDSSLPDDWNGSPTTTDPTPIIPIMPPVPGASTTTSSTTLVASTPTTDPSDVTYQQSQDLLNNMVGGTAPGGSTVGVVAATAGALLTGCEGNWTVQDPNGYPVIAPPSSTTNPPTGVTSPDSSSPVPLTLTQPTTDVLVSTSPSPSDGLTL